MQRPAEWLALAQTDRKVCLLRALARIGAHAALCAGVTAHVAALGAIGVAAGAIIGGLATSVVRDSLLALALAAAGGRNGREANRKNDGTQDPHQLAPCVGILRASG